MERGRYTPALSDQHNWLLNIATMKTRPPTEAAYLIADEIVENVDLRCVPSPVMTGRTATAIPVAIRPYSIAVAAFSSFKNLTNCTPTPSGKRCMTTQFRPDWLVKEKRS